MPNYAIALDHLDQKDHLLLDLYAQLHGVSKAIGDLSTKTADPTYNQAATDDLILKQNLIMARIAEIKADQPFRYPTDEQIGALGKACDALAAIDSRTASAVQLLNAANALVAALPVTATKP